MLGAGQRLLIGALGAAAMLPSGCASPARRPDAPAPATPSTAPQPAWETIGRSVHGRPIEAATIGLTGPSVLVVGGIHGDEPEGGRTIEALAAHLRAARPPVRVRIVRDANPDGTAAGSRANARGVDLNRNWPASNFSPGEGRGAEPLSEPEARALFGEIRRARPDVVIVCHASRSGPFVNFDGPGAELAAAFATGAAMHDPRWRIVPQMGYATPGSLGTYVGVDGGVPILTIEFARGHGAETAWLAMRDGFGAVAELLTSSGAR